MNVCLSGINGELRRAITAVALSFCFIILIYPAVPSASPGPDRKFTVFKADFDITPVKNKDEKLVKDFYINGGENDGITGSTVLEVYREKVVRDSFLKREAKISILIGQMKVIKVFGSVAIARITHLVSSEETPVLQYRSVMIGDYAVPAKKEKSAGAIRPVPTLSGAPPSTNAGTPKLYSLIKASAGRGNMSAPGVSFPSHVLFAFDDWRLKPESLHAISEAISVFNKNNDRQIIIEGHTCSIGGQSYNLELSKKRAQSVADYLVNVKGIPADNIRIEYYGELFPVAPNENETGREQNRRVDIRFSPLSKKERLLKSLVKK